MDLAKSILDRCGKQGFAVEQINNEQRHWLFLQISMIGRIRVSLLRPRLRSNEAGRLTLSNLHGLDDFPFHTDRAFEARPPRFVFLFARSQGHGDTKTLVTPIAKLNSDFRRLLRLARWMPALSNGQSSLSGAIIDATCNGYRFDTSLMSPANAAAQECKEIILPEFKRHSLSFSLREDNLVCIDNWRSVHARSHVEPQEVSGRIIERWELWPYAGMVVRKSLG